MSIVFEHWPLDEIPTLLCYMISQESSAVTLVPRVVHGESKDRSASDCILSATILRNYTNRSASDTSPISKNG